MNTIPRLNLYVGYAALAYAGLVNADVVNGQSHPHSREQYQLTVGTTVGTSTEYTSAFAERLETQLRPHGVSKIAFYVAGSNRELQDEIDNRHIDIIYSHGLAVAKVLSINPSALVLQSTEAIYDKAQVVIVVKKDSPLQSLADLVGHSVVLEDTTQRRSFFTPAWLLQKEGLKLAHIDNIRIPPSRQTVGIALSGKDTYLTEWLLRGLTDAAAYRGKDWRNKRIVPNHVRPRLRELYNDSVELHAYVVLVSRVAASLDKEIANALSEPLFEAEHGHFEPLTTQHDQYLNSIAQIIHKSNQHATK